MSAGIWLYNEKICEGHECIKDCDKCAYADRVVELEDEEYSKPIQDGVKEQVKCCISNLNTQTQCLDGNGESRSALCHP